MTDNPSLQKGRFLGFGNPSLHVLMKILAASLRPIWELSRNGSSQRSKRKLPLSLKLLAPFSVASQDSLWKYTPSAHCQFHQAGITAGTLFPPNSATSDAMIL